MNISRLPGKGVCETLPPVAISVLGSFCLTVDGYPMPLSSESKGEHLLLCLVLAHQHRMVRDDLLERVWPHSNSTLAGQSLNSLVHQLNKLTNSSLNGTGVITRQGGYYSLNLSNGVWIDIDQFERWSELGERLLLDGDELGSVDYWKQALALYHGDLCGDSTIETVIIRERLRVIFLNLLSHLARHAYTQGNPTEALAYINRLLIHDPCREDAHRQGMRCYLSLNQRAQALRQYRICCQALAKEFDALPEPATVALFDQIRLNIVSIEAIKFR